MSKPRMRNLFACGALAVSLLSVSLGAWAKAPVVVELFTSQGCSNCPPADAFLSELAQRDDVIALSYPITYWDHLGWRDTLARPEHTERQRSYNRSLGKDMVYTPEMVIGGSTHEVGSRREIVTTKIKELGALTQFHAQEIIVTQDGGHILLELPTSTAAMPACTIWFVPFTSRETVNIGSGENQGRTIAYTNVARSPRKLGLWSGDEMTVALELSDDFRKAFSGFALLVQDNETGPIRAAAKVMLD